VSQADGPSREAGNESCAASSRLGVHEIEIPLPLDVARFGGLHGVVDVDALPILLGGGPKRLDLEGHPDTVAPGINPEFRLTPVHRRGTR
jgi:hypothetical protein